MPLQRSLTSLILTLQVQAWKTRGKDKILSSTIKGSLKKRGLHGCCASRCRKESHSAVEVALDSALSSRKTPARTSSLSPAISSATLGGHASSRRSQSPSKNGKNTKNIQKQTIAGGEMGEQTKGAGTSESQGGFCVRRDPHDRHSLPVSYASRP